MKTTEKDVKEMFAYLDRLRDKGTTNMFGAGQYLEGAFALDKYEARKVLSSWMKTFGKGTMSQRVALGKKQLNQ